MKRLILLRHAKSDWSNIELTDFQRPLNERGRKDAPEMGRRIRKTEFNPEIILVSTANRTKETISLFVSAAEWEKTDLIEKDWLYLASQEEYIKYIEKMHDEVTHLCICGHNPTISNVINYFAGESITNVPTCGIAVIDFEFDSWKEIGFDTGKLIYYDYPKNTQFL